MRNPADIPRRNIKTSSTKRGKTPENVRPGRSVWASKKNDKKPRIEITLGDKPIPTRSVKVIKARNVKKVQVVFVLSNNKKVRKVSIAIFIDLFPSDFTFTSKCHTFIWMNNLVAQFLRHPSGRDCRIRWLHLCRVIKKNPMRIPVGRGWWPVMPETGSWSLSTPWARNGRGHATCNTPLWLLLG